VDLLPNYAAKDGLSQQHFAYAGNIINMHESTCRIYSIYSSAINIKSGLSLHAY